MKIEFPVENYSINNWVKLESVNIFQALQVLTKSNHEIEVLLKKYLDYRLPHQVEVKSDNTFISINYPGGLNPKMLNLLNISQKDIEFQTYRDCRDQGVECVYYLKWEHVLRKEEERRRKND